MASRSVQTPFENNFSNFNRFLKEKCYNINNKGLTKMEFKMINSNKVAYANKMGAKMSEKTFQNYLQEDNNGTFKLVYIVIENGEIKQVFDNERVAKFYIGAQSVKRQKAMKIVEKMVKSNLGN